MFIQAPYRTGYYKKSYFSEKILVTWLQHPQLKSYQSYENRILWPFL